MSEDRGLEQQRKYLFGIIEDLRKERRKWQEAGVFWKDQATAPGVGVFAAPAGGVFATPTVPPAPPPPPPRDRPEGANAEIEITNS